MNGRRAYLDYNASAPLLDVARAVVIEALDAAGNPSSVHNEGRRARQIVETARRQVAALVNGRPEHVVFTSGATEAAMTLLTPEWRMGRAPLRMARLLVCESDHPCLWNGGRFPQDRIVRIGVDENGIVNLGALRAALDAHPRDEGPALLAIHAVNNETGVVQPLAEIAALAREAGAVLVLDAVQAAGRIALDLAAGMADYFILSSHKIGGPKGAGAIVAASDLMMPAPLVTGGGQEKGHRAGTEALPAIAGFGAAAEAAAEGIAQVERLAALRDGLEKSVIALCPGAVFHGAAARRVANTTFFSIPGMKAETVQIAFDLAGVAVSAGSACSSGKVGPSHVLAAMGFEGNLGAVRVSIGAGTGQDDVEAFGRALAAIVARRDSASRAA